MLWVPLVYHPYRFAGRVETAREAVSVFIRDCPLTTNVYILQSLPPRLLPCVLAVSSLIDPVLPLGPAVRRNVRWDWGDGYRKRDRWCRCGGLQLLCR